MRPQVQAWVLLTLVYSTDRDGSIIVTMMLQELYDICADTYA